MEPEEKKTNSKNYVCPITNQINRYKNPLPEISRSQGFFFFKEVTRQMQQITYITIGYRVGPIPYQLQDLFAVAINIIHYSCQFNLKIIIDGDQLWVTGSVGSSTEEANSMGFKIQQAHLNESLIKSQQIMKKFLQECKAIQKREDSVLLQKVKKQVISALHEVFKNPDYDD